jgi:hypothetical protein
MTKDRFCHLRISELFQIMLMMITKANTHSTLLSALKTILPIPKPKGRFMPGARNLSQASIKLMAHTKPIQRNVQIRAMGHFYNGHRIGIDGLFL